MDGRQMSTATSIVWFERRAPMTAHWPTGTTAPEADTADFRNYLRPIWAHKFLVLVLVVAATVGTYAYYDRQPRVYRSSTDIFVGPANPAPGVANTALPPSDRTIADQARLMQTHAVAARVARRIGFDGDPRRLLADVSVTAAEGSDFLLVTGTASQPEAAARLANAFAQAFIDVRASDRRKLATRTLNDLERQLAGATAPGSDSLRRSLNARINAVRLAQATPSGDASQVDAALPATEPMSPRPRRNAIFAFGLSLMLGIIAAFGLERIDRRIKSSEEAEAAYRLPVIAAIRHVRRIVPKSKGEMSVAEGVRETFRSLRSNIELAADSQPVRTILVASAIPDEGKSTVVRNLALVYAEAGFRVAILEADLRRPSLARTLGAQSAPGLTDVLMGLAPLAEVVQLIDVQVPDARIARSLAPSAGDGGGTAVATMREAGSNGSFDHSGQLDFIASGPRPADPPAMFSAPGLRALVERLADDHDIVLVDSPPLLAVSDAVPLMSVVDGTILVCRVGKSTDDGAERVLKLTSRMPDARILGLVVNDVDDGGFNEKYKDY
jgi:Mrp family chromosome partitioning ATPase/capsular polysaccharide biosynthesis protein